jgi:hypothetical protein
MQAGAELVRDEDRGGHEHGQPGAEAQVGGQAAEPGGAFGYGPGPGQPADGQGGQEEQPCQARASGSW